jgi:hypothetical protein
MVVEKRKLSDAQEANMILIPNIQIKILGDN